MDRLTVDDLVRVGIACGPSLAYKLYRHLHEQPVDAYGEFIDWTEIHPQITEAIEARERD